MTIKLFTEARMLVLTREEGESLILGDSIVISIVEIKGRSVRVGITAPNDVKILRQELYIEATGNPPPETSMGDRGRTGASRRRKAFGEGGEAK